MNRKVSIALPLILPFVGLTVLLHSKVAVADEANTISPPAISTTHAVDMKAGLKLFQSDVRHLLSDNCLRCHGGESVKGEFDLSSREALLASGYYDNKKPSASHLLAVVKHESEPFMPEGKPKLDEASIKKLEEWLRLGAPFDAPLIERDVDTNQPSPISQADRDFWSFRRF
jgi:cytochrome c553